MFWLPPIAIDGRTHQLPISRRAASKWTSALALRFACEQSFPAYQHLIETPGLFVWALTESGPLHDSNLVRFGDWMCESPVVTLFDRPADRASIVSKTRVRHAGKKYRRAVRGLPSAKFSPAQNTATTARIFERIFNSRT